MFLGKILRTTQALALIHLPTTDHIGSDRDEFKEVRQDMAMPEATKEQLKNEVIHALHKHSIEFGCVPLTEEIMDTVVKAWYFGRDTGYREARDA